MSDKKTTAEHAVFRVSAEERGYRAALVDDQGCEPGATGRPPTGVILSNLDGDAMWIEAAHLPAVADMLIRAYVQVARKVVR